MDSLGSPVINVASLPVMIIIIIIIIVIIIMLLLFVISRMPSVFSMIGSTHKIFPIGGFRHFFWGGGQNAENVFTPSPLIRKV